MRKKCIDCIHYAVCSALGATVRFSVDDGVCLNFEDRSLFLKTPCKVGDTVYNKEAEPFTVTSIEWFANKKVTHIHCHSATGRRKTFALGKRSLNKTVFLSLEAALQVKTATKEGADNG